MQVLFYIGLIGILFTTVTFINTSVTITAMQKKRDQIEKVEEIFSDIEFAVNNNILLKDLDLTGEDLTSLEFASGLVGWNLKDLSEDPWSKPYRVLTEHADETIYSDVNGVSGNNVVDARLTAFAIVSAGPDGVFGNESTAWPSTYNGIRSFMPDNRNAGGAGEDDIYITFTTYPSAIKMWNKIKTAHDKVKSVTLHHYSNQLELFQPEIENYYEGLDIDDVFDGNTYILDDNSWMAALSGTAGFPQMTSDLEIMGISGEIENLSVGIAVDVSTAVNAYSSVANVIVENPGQGISNQWDITYGNTIYGSSLVAEAP